MLKPLIYQLDSLNFMAVNNADGCQSTDDILRNGACDCRITSIKPIIEDDLIPDEVLVSYVGSNTGTLNINGQSINLNPDFGGSVKVELIDPPFGRELIASFADSDCSGSIILPEEPSPIPTMNQWTLILFGFLLLSLVLLAVARYQRITL